jgi:hypothetical protein
VSFPVHCHHTSNSMSPCSIPNTISSPLCTHSSSTTNSSRQNQSQSQITPCPSPPLLPSATPASPSTSPCSIAAPPCHHSEPVISFPKHTAGFSTTSISLCSENMIKKMMMTETKEGKTTKTEKKEEIR